MDTLGERLKYALRERGVKVRDLCKRAGLSASGIYFIIDGTTKPSKIRSSTIDKLSNAIPVNREWLLRDVGSMDDTIGTQGQRTALRDARPMAEVQLVASLIARALAASIPAAGRDLLAELERIAADDLRPGTFLGEFAASVRVEISTADHQRRSGAK